MYYACTNLKILGNIYKHFTCLAALAWNKDLKDEQSNERAWYDKHIENNIRRGTLLTCHFMWWKFHWSNTFDHSLILIQHTLL